MPDITGSGTSQQLKEIFGFIWEMGRHILNDFYVLFYV